MSEAGLDRLSLSFPVAGGAAAGCSDDGGLYDHDPAHWDTVITRNVKRADGKAMGVSRSYGKSVRLVEGEPSVYVGVQVIDGVRPWGKVEFNPSRVLDPAGWGLAPIDDLRDAAMWALQRSWPLVESEAAVSDMRVKRLDVAKDFASGHGEFYLRALAPVHRPWARRNLVHFDPSRKGAQTLMVGSAAGVVRLYDKHAETDGHAPAGTLRWEAECRGDWLRNYAEIETVRDITRESVSRLALNRWNWSAMGTTVGAIDRVVELALRPEAGMSKREIVSFLGYVTLMANGSMLLSKNTSTKYRGIARKLGVSLGEWGECEAAAARFLGRLDWDSAAEELCAA